MPTYEYSCNDCGERLEVVQSIHDDSLTTCPNCGGTLRKHFGNVGVVFKGSGFYKTDSRDKKSSSTTATKSSSDSSDSSGSGSSDSGSAASTDSTATPAKDSGSNSTSDSSSATTKKPVTATDK